MNPNQIQPRNGHTLMIGIVARISGCTNQKELSLEDQEDHGKEVVAEMYQGPAEYRVIATKGKGERLDRPELDEIERWLRSRELDLLVMEDIGRMVRGAEAVRLCGIGVDHGTRVIAPHDFIDTVNENWEEDVMEACKEHVGHNRHTSRRLKHKLMNRFIKLGGATALEIFGFVKPEGAKTYDEWKKESSVQAIYDEWLRILRETLNCSAVADWLNQESIPPGKYARREKWDGKMVRRITRNPLLKGLPGRGFKHTVKHHETGRRVAVPNPRGPHFKECPHLAFWPAADFDDINARLEARNKGFGRKRVNGEDPLARVPRKRTRFPGQFAKCWYCGRQYMWGGNGVNENLMCKGPREWHCWNSIGFNGALAAKRVATAITTELHRLDGFDAQMRGLIQEAAAAGPVDLAERWERLLRSEEKTARENRNLAAAIAEYGPQPSFQEKLNELKAADRALGIERRELENLRNRSLELPRSTADLRRTVEEKFAALAMDCPDFGDLMRHLVVDFYVFLVRLCDGGHLLPRAKVRLNLAGMLADVRHVPGLTELLGRELTLDLFDLPPQRERIRIEAVNLANQGFEQREIAKHLSESVTQTAVFNALALDRTMRGMGLTSPYLLVMEPPPDYLKLRRHNNAKYRFEPLDGYQRPALE